MNKHPPPRIVFPNGEAQPALGLGTWRLGEDDAQRAAEVASLRLAFDIGYRVVDTAEMYGDAESVLGTALAEALRGGLERDDVFIVSKVLPNHADARGVRAAFDASRRRIGVDVIDLYLLHWRGGVPLAETVSAFEDLQRRGDIRQWGVSNFDVDDLQELAGVPGGAACATNQVMYSLDERGVEHTLLPWQRAQSMPLMAYCPIGQGSLATHRNLSEIAQRLAATPAQVALAWLLHQPGVMAIPKAVREEHLRQNFDAARLVLSDVDRAELDRHFAPPRRKQPLAMR